ncbi:MAG TPA: SRPBCC domain-containing protein [Candidatus Paceibacterota bacterium]|nr:SRPBCC domain-containing protein [Candidatus Paceibacterota bacterium]
MEPKEVTFERTYEAPAERIWQAWTDPGELARWWGPDNVRIPECEVDLRVGGRFYIVMEATEAMGPYAGTRWPMDATYTAIEPNEKLGYSSKAWTEGDEDATMIEQEALLTLAEEGGMTKMTLVITVTSIGPKAGAAIEGMQYGFNQQFDKLAAHLAA